MFSFRANYCYDRPSSMVGVVVVLSQREGGLRSVDTAAAVHPNVAPRCTGAVDRVAREDRVLTAMALVDVRRHFAKGVTNVTCAVRAGLSEKGHDYSDTADLSSVKKKKHTHTHAHSTNTATLAH